MAAAIASRGISVVGVDVNQRAVDVLNAGRAPVRETGLDDLIASNREHLRATTRFSEAVHDSAITFVVVPTPSDDDGGFSLEYAAAAFVEIGRALKSKSAYHLVVLTSTVLPGATRYGLLPILEAESGKHCGEAFGLCYSPEFIALGSVIRDFLNPDLVLIGESDMRAGDRLEACYRAVLTKPAPAARMSLENAELTKIALNTYVTTKISFANTLAALCERVPGGNVDVVTRALGLDTRIGPRFLTGATGYGGPCFPRDNRALIHFAESVGVRADLAEATDAINERVHRRVVDRVLSVASPEARVAVLGIAYKPASHITEESQGLAVATALHAAGFDVRTFDPLAGDLAWAAPLEECLRDADVIVVATPEPAFRALGVTDFANAARGALVLDCWRVLNASAVREAGLRYSAIGVSVDDERNAARLSERWRRSPRAATRI